MLLMALQAEGLLCELTPHKAQEKAQSRTINKPLGRESTKLQAPYT